jgi:hypothetical protein
MRNKNDIDIINTHVIYSASAHYINVIRSIKIEIILKTSRDKSFAVNTCAVAGWIGT